MVQHWHCMSVCVCICGFCIVWDLLFFLELNCTARQCYSKSEKAGVRSEGWTNSPRHGLGLWEDMIGKGFSGFERPAYVHVSVAQGRTGDGESDNRGTLDLIMWRNERSAWLVHSWECWRGLSGCSEDHCSVTSYRCTSALCVYLYFWTCLVLLPCGYLKRNVNKQTGEKSSPKSQIWPDVNNLKYTT